MGVPLPFKVSIAAEEHIRALLAHDMPAGMELGIVRAFGGGSQSADGEVVEKFTGEHFMIAGDSPKVWIDARSSVRSVIAGREFWIPRDTLAALRGKTLTVKSKDVGVGRHAGTMRDLLVAA